MVQWYTTLLTSPVNSKNLTLVLPDNYNLHVPAVFYISYRILTIDYLKGGQKGQYLGNGLPDMFETLTDLDLQAGSKSVKV